VANVGVTGLAISSLTFVGLNPGDFTQTNNCPVGGTLLAGRNCRINVTFRATATGVRTATLRITDSDITSPQNISLTGTGVQPNAALSPTSLNFGTVARRSTNRLTVTLSNTGLGLMTINGVAINGPNANQYSATNGCSATLAPNANCTITVTFNPNQRGTMNATLNVNDNAPGSPQTVTLTGVSQ